MTKKPATLDRQRADFLPSNDQRFGASPFDSLPFGSAGVVIGFCDGPVLAPDVVGAMLELLPFMPSFGMSLFILVLLSCAAGPVVPCAKAAPDKPSIAVAAIAAVKRFVFIWDFLRGLLFENNRRFDKMFRATWFDFHTERLS
jgi:hypothetical protein